jgi:hypothetical protein
MSSPVSLGTVNIKDLKNTWSDDTGAHMVAKSSDNLRYKRSNYVDVYPTPKFLEPIFTDVFSSEGSEQHLSAVRFPASLLTSSPLTLTADDGACPMLHGVAGPILDGADGSRSPLHGAGDPPQEGGRAQAARKLAASDGSPRFAGAGGQLRYAACASPAGSPRPGMHPQHSSPRPLLHAEPSLHGNGSAA